MCSAGGVVAAPDSGSFSGSLERSRRQLESGSHMLEMRSPSHAILSSCRGSSRAAEPSEASGKRERLSLRVHRPKSNRRSAGQDLLRTIHSASLINSATATVPATTVSARSSLLRFASPLHPAPTRSQCHHRRPRLDSPQGLPMGTRTTSLDPRSLPTSGNAVHSAVHSHAIADLARLHSPSSLCDMLSAASRSTISLTTTFRHPSPDEIAVQKPGYYSTEWTADEPSRDIYSRCVIHTLTSAYPLTRLSALATRNRPLLAARRSSPPSSARRHSATPLVSRQSLLCCSTFDPTLLP